MRCAVCGGAYNDQFAKTAGPRSGRVYLTSKITCCNAVTVLILEDGDLRAANMKHGPATPVKGMAT